MGKLLPKLLHGIVPSWLYAVFKRPYASSKKLLHFRLRHGIHLMSNKSFSPTSPSSSPLTTELVSLLMDVDQNTYYYSQSEDEEQHPLTGSKKKHTPSINIVRKRQDEDDDSIAYCHPAGLLFTNRDESTGEKTGICAPVAAATILTGSLHKDKHEPPMAINMEFMHATSPASIILPIQHVGDHQMAHHYHQDHHQQQQTMRAICKGCQYDDDCCGLGCDDAHHQPSANGGCYANQHPQCHNDDGPHATQHPQKHADDGSHATQPPEHHADDGPPYHAHHDACNVYQYNHNREICGSHDSQFRAMKPDITKKNRVSHPRQSLAMNAKKGNQDGNQHHHLHRQHGMQNDKHHLHDTLDYQHPHAHPLGSKRKSMCLDEDDVEEDNEDGHCTWPCLKRQKGANVRCELPERICAIVGNGSAVVKYSYQDPQFAFWESMVEMILCNGLWGDVGKLEFLLHCYLALNDPELHHAIHTSFLQVLKDLPPASVFKAFPL